MLKFFKRPSCLKFFTIFNLIFISSLFLASFIFFNLTHADGVNPVISQVQINGLGGSDQDFIKIFNPNNSPFSLKGRLVKKTSTQTESSLGSFLSTSSIPANGFFVWANNKIEGFADSINADMSRSYSLSSDNSIALELDGIIIDSIAWGNASNTFPGFQTNTFPENPKAGEILARKNNTGDFEIISSGATVDNPEPIVSSSGGGGTIPTTHDHTNLVAINEVVSDPDTDTQEWIELYNKSTDAVDIAGWTVEDGSGSKTTLAGVITKYFVIEAPKGNLNNAGDIIILKDELGTIIDQMAYGDWLDNKNNAPVAKSPDSLARIIDGQKSGTDKIDWSITTTPTKNSTNIITTPSLLTETKETVTEKITCPLIINEVFPDPIGSDSAGEFIEIFNHSDKDIDLAGWTMEIKNQLPFIFPTQIIKTGEHLSLNRKQSHLVLPNDSETIKLIKPKEEKVCFQLKYSDVTIGNSYGLNEDTLVWSKPKWLWTRLPTPGQKNSILTISQAPTAVINYQSTGNSIFVDASDSFDANGDQLSFIWDFGDNTTSINEATEHFYLQPGKYKITLTASDGYLNNVSAVQITIGDNQPSVVTKINSTSKQQTTSNKKVTNTLSTSTKKTTAIKKTTSKKTPTKKTTTKKTSTVKKITTPKKTTTTTSQTGTLQISGTVLDTPKTFSSLYFFIIPDNEAQAWQIYRQKGDLPALKPGQKITVTGRRSSLANVKRLLISNLTDIKLNELSTPIEPTGIKATDKNNYLGQLVTVTGEVTDRASDNLYLDDGSTELFVRFKAGTGLTPSNFNPGEKHTLRGLLVMGAKEIELWPRNLADTDLESLAELKPTSSTSTLATTTKPKNEFLPHLLITLSAVLIIAIIILIKTKKK